MFHFHQYNLQQVNLRQFNLDVNRDRAESLQRNSAIMAEALNSTVSRLLDEEFGGYRPASMQEMEQFLDQMEATLKN